LAPSVLADDFGSVTENLADWLVGPRLHRQWFLLARRDLVHPSLPVPWTDVKAVDEVEELDFHLVVI